MRMNYFFDVDGTLTPHRQKIDKEFKKFFENWATDKMENGDSVILVQAPIQRKHNSK